MPLLDKLSGLLRRQPNENNTPEIAQEQRITKSDVSRAMEILREYKSGKTSLDHRIIENERWSNLQQWELINPSNDDPKPVSAWLFNCIANKHADIMDNFPSPNVLPREQSDEPEAKKLSSILPVVLEQNDYEQTYSDKSWYKLKKGTGVEGVFWNKNKDGGIGDIDIKCIDLLNLFWEPGINDIQKSKHLFNIEIRDNELLEQEYPTLKGKLSGGTITVEQYIYDDSVDTSKKSAVVDWYYKKKNTNGMEILHFCKFCNGEVLYATENDPELAERGLYDHGEYPFVFDTLFNVEGTPAGLGYIDLCKDPQLRIDKLNQVILKNADIACRLRWLISGSGKVNEAEYADHTKEFVHVDGVADVENSLKQIKVDPLPEIYVSILNNTIEELKETTGNRDFSQGGTSRGVTAASAIAALQEAGSKLSRDMIKSSYRAFTQVCYFVIELIRQFYTEPRCFRITGEQGNTEFVTYTNQNIAMQTGGEEFGLDIGYRKPIFDIKVTSQKSSPFSTVAQNERAKELYGMGFFRPDMADQALAALDMMDFEGIDKVRQRVSENGTLMQMVQQLQQQMMMMAQIIDSQNGTSMAPQLMAPQQQEGTPVEGSKQTIETNALGDTFKQARDSTAGAARTRAAASATPRV